MSIADVIGWKFNHQAGMRCKEIDGVITIIEFPNGIPSQSDQDTWTTEYNNYIAGGGLEDEAADINTKFEPLLKAFALVVLDEINILRTQAALPVRTVQNVKDAIKAKL